MKHRILNAGKTVELYVYDYVGGWLGGITPQMVADTLKDAGKVELINVRINSPGGDVFDGITIYNQLKRHAARVEIDIDGLCGSIATIIAMAGDKVRMASNGTFMIHNPMSGSFGSADDLRKQAELLDQAKENLLDTYVAKSGANRNKLSALMDEETWMRAGDALDYGLVDEVTDELEMAACFDLSRFKNPPSNLSKGPLVNPNRARLAANARKVRQVCG